MIKNTWLKNGEKNNNNQMISACTEGKQKEVSLNKKQKLRKY